MAVTLLYDYCSIFLLRARDKRDKFRWDCLIETKETDIETPRRRVAWRLIILIVSGRSETTGSFVTWPAHREDASDMPRISDDLAVQPGHLCRSEYCAAVAVVSAARCRASVFGRDWRLSRRRRCTLPSANLRGRGPRSELIVAQLSRPATSVMHTSAFNKFGTGL